MSLIVSNSCLKLFQVQTTCLKLPKFKLAILYKCMPNLNAWLLSQKISRKINFHKLRRPYWQNTAMPNLKTMRIWMIYQTVIAKNWRPYKLRDRCRCPLVRPGLLTWEAAHRKQAICQNMTARENFQLSIRSGLKATESGVYGINWPQKKLKISFRLMDLLYKRWLPLLRHPKFKTLISWEMCSLIRNW